MNLILPNSVKKPGQPEDSIEVKMSQSIVELFGILVSQISLIQVMGEKLEELVPGYIHKEMLQAGTKKTSENMKAFRAAGMI
jgi:hypothetical protein